MRVLVALSAVVIAACGKDTKPPVSDAGPVSTITYGPAVLQKKACPANDGHPPPRSAVRGCESCKDGELCDEYSVRGNQVGQCKKHECQKDDDCSKGYLCACNAMFGPNKCLPGNCRTADDCGGRECAGSLCRTKDDTCKANTDCKDGKACLWSGTKFDCQTPPPPPPPG